MKNEPLTWKEVKEELKRDGAFTPEEWDEIDSEVDKDREKVLEQLDITIDYISSSIERIKDNKRYATSYALMKQSLEEHKAIRAMIATTGFQVSNSLKNAITGEQEEDEK